MPERSARRFFVRLDHPRDRAESIYARTSTMHWPSKRTTQQYGLRNGLPFLAVESEVTPTTAVSPHT